MNRGRVIQIATSAVVLPVGDPTFDAPKVYQTLFALCEDGTLWARECMDGVQRWIAIPTPNGERNREIAGIGHGGGHGPGASR